MTDDEEAEPANATAIERVKALVAPLNQALDEVVEICHFYNDLVRREEMIFKKATYYIVASCWGTGVAVGSFTATNIETKVDVRVNQYSIIGKDGADTADLFVANSGEAATSMDNFTFVKKEEDKPSPRFTSILPWGIRSHF